MKKQNKPKVTLESISNNLAAMDRKIDVIADRLDKKIDTKFDFLAETIAWSYDKLDKKIDFKFNQLDNRIDDVVENRVPRTEFAALKNRVTKLEDDIHI